MQRKLDPRSKILILIILTVICAVSASQSAELLCVAAIAALLIKMGAYKQCGIGLACYAVIQLFLFLSGLLPPAVGSVFSLIGLSFRRVLPPIMFASGLIATTKVSELVAALQSMHVPRNIIIPFAVTLRFFPTAKEDFTCLKDAMKLRGIGINAKNIFTRPHVVAESILIPTMLRSATIAEELSAAAVTRGIDREGSRTSLHTQRIGFADILWIGVFAAICIYTFMEKSYG